MTLNTLIRINVLFSGVSGTKFMNFVIDFRLRTRP